MREYINITEFIGKTFTEVKKTTHDRGDCIEFVLTDGSVYKMYHSQDCCESVYIEDICGDLQDLVGSPIVRAEAPSSLDDFPGGPKDDYGESYTWTFYILGTAKGTVTIRWYGSSNGYYSESVDIYHHENN